MEKNKTKMKNGVKIAIAAGALVVVAVLCLVLYNQFMPKPVAGEKNITVQVVLEDKTANEHKIATATEFLRGALEQEKMIEGTDGEFGLFITSVDGVKADDAKQQWWCVTKGGEQVNTGADTTPIANGDVFELTLTTGY